MAPTTKSKNSFDTHLQAASIKLHRVSALLHFSFSLTAPSRGLIRARSLRLQLHAHRLRFRDLLQQLLLNCIKLLAPLTLRLRQLRLQGTQRVVAAAQLAFEAPEFVLNRIQLRFGGIRTSCFKLQALFRVDGSISEGRNSARVQLFNLGAHGRFLASQLLRKLPHLLLERLHLIKTDLHIKLCALCCSNCIRSIISLLLHRPQLLRADCKQLNHLGQLRSLFRVPYSVRKLRVVTSQFFDCSFDHTHVAFL